MKKIEEVARAIVDRDDWDDYSPALQEACRKMARRAIETMREPTPAMLDKGPGEPYMDAYVWGRMIDAALNEGKE